MAFRHIENVYHVEQLCQPRRQLDVSRAKERFGFRAQTGFRDGLQRTIAAYAETRAEHLEHARSIGE